MTEQTIPEARAEYYGTLTTAQLVEHTAQWVSLGETSPALASAHLDAMAAEQAKRAASVEDIREHSTRTGHFHVTVVREDGEEIRRCTSPSHTYTADANLCAFDAMWKEAAQFMAEHPEVVIDPYEAHEDAHRENEQRWVERELPNLTHEDIDEMRELSTKIRRYTRYVSELLAAGKRPGDAALRRYTETIRWVSRDLAENYGLSVNVHSGNRWEIEFAGVPH